MGAGQRAFQSFPAWCLVVAAACTHDRSSTQQTAPASALEPAFDMTGVWDTRFIGMEVIDPLTGQLVHLERPLTITVSQSGTWVTATFVNETAERRGEGGGTLWGQVADHTLHGAWMDPTYYSGTCTLTVSPDGRTIAGRWAHQSGSSGAWSGTRR